VTADPVTNVQQGPDADLPRRLAAEAIGTWFLLVAVVGSGIMAESLSGGNVGVALLANTLATGAILTVLITVLGPISGAHFNPAVSLVEALAGRLKVADAASFVAVQVTAAISGVFAAHVMFGQPITQLSQHARSGWPLAFSELVATSGLVFVILGAVRHRPTAVAPIVGLYITSAYWFTASTSFANPAVTVARTLTDTFAGIRATDAPWFIAAQLVGAVLGAGVANWLNRARS
jgi:glycerol uptake facilitator-like aquaporin